MRPEREPRNPAQPSDEPAPSEADSPPSPPSASPAAASPSAPSSPSIDDRLGLELDARRLDLGDDLFRIGQQRGLGRDRQVGDLDDRVEVDEGLDRVLDRLREVIRQRPDPDVLDRVQQGPAFVIDRLRRSGRDERHVDRELLRHPDEEQVDVERAAGSPGGPGRRG